MSFSPKFPPSVIREALKHARAEDWSGTPVNYTAVPAGFTGIGIAGYEAVDTGILGWIMREARRRCAPVPAFLQLNLAGN